MQMRTVASCIAVAVAWLMAQTPGLAQSRSEPSPLVLAQAQSPARVPAAAPRQLTSQEAFRERVNQNTVTIISGNPNGGFLGIAYDISAAIDDGDDMRVLPVVGKGGWHNVRDVLHLRGIDMGITQVNTMTVLKKTGEFGANIDQRLVYITTLFEDEMHIVGTKGINTIADLNGKRVNYSDAGSGTQLTTRLVFDLLGIKATEFNMGQGDAFVKMRNGELDATVCLCAKPLKTHRELKNDDGFFSFVAIPYSDPLQDDYAPISLTSDDYPNLIPKGQTVETVALSSVLAAYNWPRETDRYRKVAQFVNVLFDKFPELHKPPRNPKWRGVNINAQVKGWNRFPAAQEWIAKHSEKQTSTASATVAPPTIDPAVIRAQAAKAAPNNLAEQERLFNEFMTWSKAQRR